MGQIPGGGNGFWDLSNERTSLNAFEQALQVFLLLPLDVEKYVNCSMSSTFRQARHSLVNVFPGASNLWLCSHRDSKFVELSCFDDAEFKQSFDCINPIRLN